MPFYGRHGIIQLNVYRAKERGKMSDRKTGRNRTMARVLCLVIAGVMTLSVILAVLLGR